MATITPTWTLLTTLNGHVGVWTWANFADADTLSPVQMGPYRDRSVHAYGTWAGSTVSIKGSNEPIATVPTNLVALHDPQGIALTMTADKIEEVSEVTNWLQPSCAGGAATAMTIQLLLASTL